MPPKYRNVKKGNIMKPSEHIVVSLLLKYFLKHYLIQFNSEKHSAIIRSIYTYTMVENKTNPEYLKISLN